MAYCCQDLTTVGDFSNLGVDLGSFPGVQNKGKAVSNLHDIHPEIKRGLEAVQTPEVQELMKSLSEHGLAVALPHLHGEDGNFMPLPKGTVSFESGLKVSFVQEGSDRLESAIPVMWRWDGETQAVGNCAMCDYYQHR
ncbi:hypothetical protein CL654_02390 [bacterium]|nr:hypothetical protein [bacterium]|tara:strand:- start:14188 stop:14601 length:414 start_codon:yes stop_codon:yes gene_type:complete